MRQEEKIMNVPNVLTMLRMALIGVFLWLFFTENRMWALAVYVLAGATDMLDGYIARKHKLITNFGKLMDPLADKLMLIAAMVSLMTIGWMPVWVLIVVVLKEGYMVLGGILLLRRRDIVVHAIPIGKAAAMLFGVAVVVTFFHETVAPWDFVLQVAAVALSLIAMVWYTVRVVNRLCAK